MLLISLLTATAWPCAGLVHEEGALAESDIQEAILEHTGTGSRVSYLAQYDGDAASFGWIIPIFGEFQAISDGDPARFDELRDSTSPAVYREYADTDSTGCGCMGASKGGDNALQDTAAGGRGFDVVAEGFTGTFDYSVIAGDDAAAMVAWLDENGWEGGSAAAAIDAYVAEGGVQFVALRLHLEAGETPSEGRELPPVVLDYGGSSLRFPAIMAKDGDVDELRTTVWVVGEARARVSGWSATELPVIEGSLDDDPTTLWLEALRAVGGMSPGYGLSWAGERDGAFLTRFDSLVHKDAHTVDATFTDDDGTTSASTEIWLYEEASSSTALFLVPLVLFGFGLRRRR